MEKYKGSFIAKDDSGEEYNIEIYIDEINVSSHDDANATIPGRKRLVTDKGEAVNYLRKGEYKIVATEVLLKSDDLRAP